MITAEDAKKRSQKNYRSKKWNILDSIQLKRIEIKIYFWSKFGREYIFFWETRPLVREYLEKNGYRIDDFGGGCSPYPVITWMNIK